MAGVIKEIPTASQIPQFVPFGQLYYAQDTGNLWIGTGFSTGSDFTGGNPGPNVNVELVAAGIGVPGGFAGDIQYNNGAMGFGGSAATVDALGNIGALSVTATSATFVTATVTGTLGLQKAVIVDSLGKTGTVGQALESIGTGLVWSTVSSNTGAWATLTGDLTSTQVIPFDGPSVGTPDTGLSRLSPGIIGFGTGAAASTAGGFIATTATIVTLVAPTATITTLTATTATITTLAVPTETVTNLTATTATITNEIATTATVTTDHVINSTIVTATITNGIIATATVTTETVGTEIVTALTATTATIATATVSGNGYVSTLVSPNATITTLTATTATIATMFGTTATVTTDNVTNANITTANITTATISYLYVPGTSNAADLIIENTTGATATSTLQSPQLEFLVQYATTTTQAGNDTWLIGSGVAAGVNGASTLTVSHSGSTGNPAVVIPNQLVMTGTTSGLVKITAPAVASTTTNPIVFSNSILLPNGTAAIPTLTFANFTNYGLSFDVAYGMTYLNNGSEAIGFSGSGLLLGPSNSVRYGTSLASVDLALSRAAAGILAVGTGAAGNITGSIQCASIALNGAVASPVAGTYYSSTAAGVTQSAEAVGTIATTGGIVTTFTAVSDERLKKSKPYGGGLKEILAIVPINYRWNEIGQKLSGQGGDRDYVGFSAQNVEKVIPEAIQSRKGPEQYLSFDDRPVIAALCNAIKELTARIIDLERKS